MNTLLIILSIASAGAVLSAQAAMAAEQTDIVLHQQAPGRTFGYASDSLYLNDSGQPFSELIADKFSLSQSLPVSRLKWFGFYGGTGILDPGPPQIEAFRIRILSDAQGLPGTSLVDQLVENQSRSWTGQLINIAAARREYVFEATLDACFVPQPTENYWLEISQRGDLESLFRWESSNTPGEFAFQAPIGTDYRLIEGLGQLAYELRTPEPYSGSLLGFGCACLLRRRAR